MAVPLLKKSTSILVGVWFLLWGVSTLFGLTGLNYVVLGVLAIIVGVTTLADR